MAQIPAVRAVDDEARLDAVLRRERKQLRARQRRHDAGQGLADQQRLLLPVTAHECLGRQPTEQRRGKRDIHAPIVACTILR